MKVIIDIEDVGWKDVVTGYMSGSKALILGVKAEEIIQCKDCKYKVVTKDGEWNPEDIVCDYWASDGLEADDFCSRGERRGEEI